MRFLLLTFFLLQLAFGLTQNEFPPVVSYTTHDYDKEKVRNPENFTVVQDNRGILYFGNSNGVLSFDGVSWNFIPVVSGYFVRALAVDDNGVVYAGTFGDFGYLEVSDAGDLVYKSLLSKVAEEDQWFSDIWYIYTFGNEVYYVAQEALYVFNKDTDEITVHYPQNSFHTAFLAGDKLYLRDRTVGIVQYADNNVKFLEGTREPFEEYGLFGVIQGENDSLLLITQELGLFNYKDGFLRRLSDSVSNPLTNIGVFGALELSNGLIALKTYSNGAYFIDKKGQIQEHYTRRNGLHSNEVKAMYEDSHNNLWFALGNGISKANIYSPISYWNEKSGFEGNVQAIIRFNEVLFIGTSYGLFRESDDLESGRKFENVNLLNNQVWDFEVVGNVLYVATSAGIYKTTNGKDYQVLTSENTNLIYYHKKKDWLIHAGSNGIHIRDGNFRSIHNHEEQLTNILEIIVDPYNPNIVWVGTTGSGAIRILKSDGEFKVDAFYEMDGLYSDNLAVPVIMNDSLYFGSSDGLLYFIDEKAMLANLEDSLKDDPMYNRGMFQSAPFYDSVIYEKQILFIADNKERTWYSIEHQLGFYDKSKKEFVTEPFKSIDYGRVNKLYLESDGDLWVGYADGLVRIQGDFNKKYDVSYPTLIRKVTINGDSTIYYGNWKDGITTPILAYANNNVQFDFSASYYEDDKPCVFSYKLEGFDKKWSEWSERTEAIYTHLSEGEYSFKVKSKNIYGYEGEEATYSFTVLPPWYRTTWAYVGYFLLFILILFLGVRIFSARLKAKNIWLEGVVEERTKEIKEKNVVLEHQKKEIEDSINYAQRIQQAILPLEQEMNKWIPQSFVLFRPKDIVSGDFYWFMEKDGKLIVICADCTGHGVPGAFMSMIGSDRLNNIVSERKITSPGKILSELNRAIKKSLKQDGQKDSTKDGMDAAICTINLETNILSYAGANRPLWVVENGNLEEIKATKVAVAGFTDDDQVYEEHEIQLRKGMKFYMSSDGYADQFGGEFEKKYKVKNMKNFIIKNIDESFAGQKVLLEQEIVDWMGSIEQIDDICVVGFEPIPEE